jgi:hypothetical protein
VQAAVEESSDHRSQPDQKMAAVTDNSHSSLGSGTMPVRGPDDHGAAPCALRVISTSARSVPRGR